MKIYRQFLASYLFVCLVPLLLSFVTIGRLEYRVQEDIMDEQESSMQSVRQEIDQTLGHAANIVSIFSEDALTSRLSEKETLDADELFALCELSESLDRAIGQNAAFFHGFCYLARSNFLVTDRRTYHPESTDLFPWDLQLSTDSFYSVLDSGSSTEHIATVYKESEGGWILVLRSQYGDLSREDLLSCMGIIIQLDKSLSSWDTEDFEAFVTNEAYELICGGDRAPEACELMSQTQRDQGELDLEGQSYVYSQYQSSLSGIRYGFLARRDSYYQELRIVWIHLILEIAAIVIASIFFAVFWSRRTYRPIKKILPFVETGQPGYQSIAELGSALVNIAQERESLETQVARSEQQVRNAALGQYLLGLTGDPSLLSQYLEEGQPYQLLAFAPAGDSMPAQAVLQGLMERLDDILLDKSGGVSLPFQKCVVALVQKALGYEEAAEIHFAVEQSLSVPLACYISNAYTRLEDAPKAWESVYRALERDSFWMLERGRGVWPACSLAESDSAESYRDFLSHQKSLTEYLSAGKRQRAKSCLETILSGDLSDKALPVEKVRRRYADTAEIILPYVDGAAGESVMRGFRQPATAREMEARLLALFDGVSWEPKPQLSQIKRELTGKVQDFIRANYQNQALNASMIADNLGMNLSTLSHQYKAATGSGLLDELHAVRLEAAKKLLEDGVSVRETAERTGYADPRALIRAFKRYEGQTPGQYAKDSASS